MRFRNRIIAFSCALFAIGCSGDKAANPALAVPKNDKYPGVSVVLTGPANVAVPIYGHEGWEVPGAEYVATVTNKGKTGIAVCNGFHRALLQISKLGGKNWLLASAVAIASNRVIMALDASNFETIAPGGQAQIRLKILSANDIPKDFLLAAEIGVLPAEKIRKGVALDNLPMEFVWSEPIQVHREGPN